MMNRKVLGICLTAVFLLASPTWAKINPESLSVGIFGGEYMFKHKEHLHTAPNYGIKVGYDFTKYFGMEFSGEGLQTKLKRDSRVDHKYRVEAYNARLDSLIYLLPEGMVVPYVSVGVGGRTINSPDNSADYPYNPGTTRNFLANAGLGAKVFLTDRLVLRGDVRSLFIFNNDNTVNNDMDLHTSTQNFEGMLGVMYVLGYKQPPKDSDGDGVTDDKDQCPGTPAGVQVDAVGCPVDSDRDGVADYLDKCPGTPAGVKVDSRGCPLDSDGDGVPDYLDQCPGTPVGVKVDAVGCEIPAPAPVVVPVPSVMEKTIIEKGRATLDIKFQTNKADIQPQYHEELARFADIMQRHPEFSVIIIEGHTDSVGDAGYNQKLSQRRAESVRNYLTTKLGVDAKRLNAKGFGESKPIADNMVASGRLQNRRVEAAVDYTVEKKVKE